VLHWTHLSLTQNGRLRVVHSESTLPVHCTHWPPSHAGFVGSFAAQDASNVQGTHVWLPPGSQIGLVGSLQSELALHSTQTSLLQMGLVGTSWGQSLLVPKHWTQAPPATLTSQRGLLAGQAVPWLATVHPGVHWLLTHNGAVFGQSVAWVATVHGTQV
jgi:hypothetical protein